MRCSLTTPVGAHKMLCLASKSPTSSTSSMWSSQRTLNLAVYWTVQSQALSVFTRKKQIGKYSESLRALFDCPEDNIDSAKSIAIAPINYRERAVIFRGSTFLFTFWDHKSFSSHDLTTPVKRPWADGDVGWIFLSSKLCVWNASCPVVVKRQPTWFESCLFDDELIRSEEVFL